MIALDANILVWGIRGIPDPNRPDMVERCKALIADLEDQKQTRLIPSVVFAEYLIGHTAEQQAEEVRIIGRHYFIAPFDGRAATIAAELYDAQVFKQIVTADGVGRQCLKTDYNVIATAIRHGASSLYVDDKHFKKIANDRIKIHPVPPLRPPGDVTATVVDKPISGRQRQETIPFEQDSGTSEPEEPEPAPLCLSQLPKWCANGKPFDCDGWLTPSRRAWGRVAAIRH